VITVSGTATVRARPDVATVRMGIQVNAANAQNALRLANQHTEALLDALLAGGVKDTEVSTNGPQLWPVDRGYQGSNEVTVIIREVDLVGSIIDTAAGAGGSYFTMGGVSFGVWDPEEHLGPARAEAIADARRKAEQFAEAAGVKVGSVVQITETASGGAPRFMAADAMMKATPVAPGEQVVTVDVVVTYNLGAASKKSEVGAPAS
jgi:uncharacterized protein YggE